MNPKVSISVDSKNKAIATITGMLTVGAKVDVEITGLPTGIEDWDATDKFVGKSLRFRIVDEIGHDLVRYPLIEKDTTATPPSDGDKWSVDADNKFTTYSGCFVNCDTDCLRRAFHCVPYNETIEFGLILDSIVDSAQFATGRIKVRQWAMCPTEDPTVLPDWRATLVELNTNLGIVEGYKTDAVNAKNAAQTARDAAQTARDDAVSAKESAQGSATSASTSASNAATNAQAAHDDRVLAQSANESAEAAKLSAEVAVTHYPQIGENENWYVWNVANGTWVDTGHKANGGHDIFKGKTFAKPTNAKGWYELLAHLIREMGGNIDVSGITPGTAPNAITMTASDGAQKMLKIVKSDGEYTTEVM